MTRTRRTASGRAGARPARTLLLLAMAGAAFAWAGASRAAPYVPADDDAVVQRLPVPLSAAARAQRRAQAARPADLPLALATARSGIEAARRSGDPRELGAAQAALAPWWHQADPPAEVRLLRATIRQANHDFDDALADLDPARYADRAPLAVRAQALLTRAAVLQVLGRLDAAAAACAGLVGEPWTTLGADLQRTARACVAEVQSLQGRPEVAARELAALARQAPDDAWLSLVRGELAWRRGDVAYALARLREATARPDPGVYALAAHADALLDAGKPRDALALLSRPDVADNAADPLELRRAIALRRLGSPQAADAARRLAARFEAAAVRADRSHLREEARLALDVHGDARRALALARENWSRQKEPADAWLLARAARAAGLAGLDPLILEAWPQAVMADRRLATLHRGVADARPVAQRVVAKEGS